MIDGREYYFQTSNRVEICAAKGMDAEHHRTLVRFVPGKMEHVKKVLDDATARWKDTRYDLGGHNCNFFTDDLLQSLGVPGLDQEYLDASGLAKGLKQVPGGSLAQELLVKWPVSDKRLDTAFMEDIKKLSRVPKDTIDEARRFGGTVSDGVKDAGGAVSDAVKRANPIKR